MSDDIKDDSDLYQEGRERMAEGRLEEAIKLFEMSAALCPHFKTLELLGECYMKLERFEEAIAPLTISTEVHSDPRAPSLLAMAYLKLNNADRAREAAEIALSRSPKNRKALAVLEALKGKKL